MKKALLRIALLSLAAGFLLIGIATGEVRVVLNKAIYVCLECIGIG